jgi:DNA-binding MarR family transcriptional regulator
VTVKRSDEPREPDPDLGMLAARLLFSVQHELYASLALQGHPDLKPRHGAVMAYVEPAGSRATELARLSGAHKQVIGTLVDELEQLGYVERRPDPRDRRAKLVVPTPKGLDEMTRATRIMAAIERRHAEAIGERAYARVKRSLRDMTNRQQTHANVPRRE